MNEFNKKARDLVKIHGRRKAKDLLESNLRHLNRCLMKSSSIDEGLDISNDIADCQALIKLINDMHIPSEE